MGVRDGKISNKPTSHGCVIVPYLQVEKMETSRWLIEKKENIRAKWSYPPD